MSNHETLSKRELEILQLIDEGLSDREIADKLALAPSTVKWYNQQIYNKLGVSTRLKAVARAHQLNLLTATAQFEAGPRETPIPITHNLPAEVTKFIGRTREIAELKRLLETTRLLTLVGPPGTGKTRLALQVARQATTSFQHGVFFVPLASIHEPAFVAKVTADALAVNEIPGQPIAETLKQVLRDRQLLLVLDNYEHLLPAAPFVAELLAASTQLKIMTTSRVILHLYGEQTYYVPPLQMPDPNQSTLTELASCEAVALFKQQAQAVQAEFELTDENALDVAKICVRLEGLPLAIELAASWIKVLTPQLLVARLAKRLDTLIGGARDLPARQQTLRATIDWSYQLLDDEEKILFRRLAVFSGRSTVEAIESVCTFDLARTALELVVALIDKSLLRSESGVDGEIGFFMLEMVREYALESLIASREADTIQERHTQYYLSVARKGAKALVGPEQIQWRRRLDAEMDNFRAALQWSLNSRKADVGLQIADALVFFWYLANRVSEGMRWFEQLLEAPVDVPSRELARALTSAGAVSFYRAAHEQSEQWCEAGLNLARECHDQMTIAWALMFLGANRMKPGMSPEAFRQVLADFEEARQRFAGAGNAWGTARALTVTGELVRLQGDYKKAESLYEAALSLFRELENAWGISMSLMNLGHVAQYNRQHERASMLFLEALVLAHEMDDRRSVASCLVGVAGILGHTGHPEQAARLFGAGAAIYEMTGTEVAPGDRPDYERELTAVRNTLGQTQFEVLHAQGRELEMKEAIQYSLTVSEEGRGSTKAEPDAR